MGTHQPQPEMWSLQEKMIHIRTTLSLGLLMFNASCVDHLKALPQAFSIQLRLSLPPNLPQTPALPLPGRLSVSRPPLPAGCYGNCQGWGSHRISCALLPLQGDKEGEGQCYSNGEGPPGPHVGTIHSLSRVCECGYHKTCDLVKER